MQLIFWQNFQNHLQSAHIRALAKCGDCEVVLVTQEEMPEWRISMGWTKPDFGRAKLIVAPSQLEIDKLISQSTKETVHIFSGISAYPMVREAFRRCLTTDALIGILSEAVNWHGVKGFLCLIKGKLEARRFRSRIDFILAIGHLGVKWFRKCGYPEEKIFPYGYFVEKPGDSKQSNKNDENLCQTKVRLMFIGQCIKRKGLDILLQALAGLKELEWSLDIIGDGNDAHSYRVLCQKLQLTEQVRFHGFLPNDSAMELLKSADLFILPSRWDGWGAVVNEALMRGVPVICSDMCGAADLIGSKERGDIFPGESVAALRKILAERILRGKRTPEIAGKIKNWSKAIEGKTAAEYLLKIIDSVKNNKPRPTPPWFK